MSPVTRTGQGTQSSIAAVIVTYHPDPDLLARVLASVCGQVQAVVVVDNGSAEPALPALVDRFAARAGVLLANPDNRGIAAAINQGIAHARGLGCSHVLILDQDSTVEPGMVDGLLAAAQAASTTGVPLAAVGPGFVDRRTGEVAPFVRIGWLRNRKLWPAPGQTVDCDFLISSGSLVSLSALDRIGPMDESLFIDNVDLEWSFRARAAGYRLLGVADARMGHAIGDRVLSVPLPGAGLAISLHGPVRLYYMTRNRLVLYRRPTTPLRWISQDIPRNVAKCLGMSLLVAPRWRNFRAMCLGVADALRGRLGPCRHRT